MLCAKTNRALRVMWRCYKPAYVFYKVIQKKATVGIFIFGIVQKLVMWQRNYMVQKKKRYSKNMYMVFLWASLQFPCSVQNSDGFCSDSSYGMGA